MKRALTALVLMLAAATPAIAATKLPAEGPRWCEQHAFMADVTWTGGFGGPPELIDWPDAMKNYETHRRYVASCVAGPAKDLFNAYLAADRAMIDHHSGRDARDDLNLARQLFTKCAARYYGKPQGATCETMAQTLTGYLVRWGSAS